jgi:hypothetical protein
MLNTHRPNISMLFISCNIQLNNGKSLGVNGLYTNINGIKRVTTFLTLPNRNLEEDLDNEIFNYNRNSERCFKTLGDIHQKNLQRTRSQFFDVKKRLENKNDDAEIDDLISKKKRELENLKQSEKDIDLLSTTCLNDTYMQTEVNTINQKKDLFKKKVDKKYQFNRPNLEIDKNDKEKMHGYMNNIKKLNRYSSNSNYKKVINDFNLNNYV